MSNLTAAQAAKKEATLNKVFRYPEGDMSRKQWLKMKLAQNCTVAQELKNKIDFNRTKYNRMNGEEQAEYERKCNEKVPSFRLKEPNGSFYEITATEYECFLELETAEQIATAKHDLENRIEAGLATEQEIAEDEQKEIDFMNKYFK